MNRLNPAPRATCIAELAPGALDIIGDIHGELDALESLLAKLGYDDQGRHVEGRRLVFVGDLIDRGPNSPGVLRRVIGMVGAGNAQCIYGNHELNAVRDQPEKHRSGEGWWYGRHESGYDYALVDPVEKEEVFLPFLHSLPGALERDGLRVIHACWHEPSIEKLRNARNVIDAFRAEEEALTVELEPLIGPLRAAWKERGMTPGSLKDPDRKVEIFPELARYDELNQMGNAIKVATSGMERPALDSFFASGKWRMVSRTPWWSEYSGPPVVVGHYWRRYAPDPSHGQAGSEADLFEDTAPHLALGPAKKVMCIDYSVGMRFAERKQGSDSGKIHFEGCLAALRVPEWELVFDDDRPSLRVDIDRDEA